MKTPDSPKLPEAYRNREWAELTQFERDAVIAEIFDMAPPGVLRPFKMAGDVARWVTEDMMGSVPVPQFTRTWASAMKVVQKLQQFFRDNWFDGPLPVFRMEATIDGWDVEVRCGDTLLAVACGGKDKFPDTAMQCALQEVMSYCAEAFVK